MSIPTTEHRHFSRVPFLADARVQVGNELHPCVLLDIALKGALFEVDEQTALAPQQTCRLLLPLGMQSARQIVMDGEVVHHEGRRVGIECRHIDIDSLTDLRRLVELNLGSDEFLHRELSELLERG